MTIPSHLRSLQAIEMALRTGSLKDAAEALGITPAAAGQRIKALETFLGLDLMMRGRSGLVPSPALDRAVEHLAAGFRELGIAAELLELQRAQTIRIRTSGDVRDLWLAPRLDRFGREFPNIHVAFVEIADQAAAADCTVDLIDKNRTEQADLLFADRVCALGSPDLERRIGAQPVEARLTGFPLIHHGFHANDPAIDTWEDWCKEHGLGTASSGGVRFSALASALEAAVAGAGIVRVGLAFAQRQLELGSLVRIFGPDTDQQAGLSLAARFRPGILNRPQVRRFRQWLLTEAAETAGWLNRQTH